MAQAVAVIGAGVSGLTTATCLAEAGHPVTVRAAAPPPQTTSAVAGAMITAVGDIDPTSTGWAAATVAEMRKLAEQPGTGVRIAGGLFAARPAFPAAPPGADTLPGFRMAAASELPAGFGMGFRADVPLVDMPRYLAYLLERLAETGVTVEIGRVDSLSDAAADAPIVVNCAGLGARELAGDDTVYGIRGQHVVVRNPGLTDFFLEAPLGPTWAGYFPHGGHVVLGGVADKDDQRTEADPAIATRIIAACAAVEPRLADAPVISHQVGFRPARARIRVAAEQRGSTLVVHNYGHGGNGVTMSWGCARQVVALVRDATIP